MSRSRGSNKDGYTAYDNKQAKKHGWASNQELTNHTKPFYPQPTTCSHSTGERTVHDACRRKNLDELERGHDSVHRYLGL